MEINGYPLFIFNYSIYYQINEQKLEKDSMDDHLVKHCKETLKKNNLEPIKKLGKGSYGLVFLVSKPSYEAELYSVKCTYKKQFVKKPVLRRYLKQEITLMETLEHPNLVKLVRTFEDDGWIFMVMEYCDLGNISLIQAQKYNGLFSFEECSSIVQEVIQGLKYMHNHNILHRDIKPENILRKKTKKGLVTKICDLGFSHEGIEEANTFCGTTYYMAPQIFNKSQYDWKVDIWALGVLIYTMLFGFLPFNGMNVASDIQAKCQNGFDLSKRKLKSNPSVSKQKMKELTKMFQGIFQLDPQKRISLEQIQSVLSTQSKFNKKVHTLNTVDTDNSDEDSSKTMEMELDKVWFVQLVLDQVSALQYLQPMQFMTLKFYLDKVCLSILNYVRQSKRKVLPNSKMIDKLWESQKRDINILNDTLSTSHDSKLKSVKIRKSVNFQEYKEEYRLVVGHAFYKAHKCIKDVQMKMQTKLMLLCCHLINRVFEREYQSDIFKHYFQFQRKKSRGQNFEVREFVKWIREDEVKHIMQTIETINNKFYHKNH